MGTRHPRRLRTGLLIGVAVYVAAVLLRLAWLDQVFVDGRFWIFHDDPPYHLRRALMTLVDWPHVPGRDAFVNFPHGGAVIWPPGLAWLLAGLGRLLGATGPKDRAVLEALATFLPPLLGGLLAPLVFAAARTFLRRGPALLAAAFVVVAPEPVQLSAAGRYDHHAVVPVLALGLVFALLRSASSATRAGRWRWNIAGGIVIGVAMLTWPAVLFQMGLLVAGVLLIAWTDPSGGRSLARAGAWIFALGIPASLPAVLASPWSGSPAFFAPSPLHPVCLGVAALALGCSALRSRSTWALRLGGIGAGAAVLLAIPSLRQALLGGLGYASGSPFSGFGGEAERFLADPLRSLTLTTLPLLLAPAYALIPLLRHLGHQRESRPRGSARPLIALLSILLFAPALFERRWLATWVPFAAIMAAAAWTPARNALASLPLPRRSRFAGPLLGLLVAASLLPSTGYLLRLNIVAPVHRAGQSFLHRIRAATPPPSRDEFDPMERPRYGILAPWWMGHLVTYLAGRPTLATNFFGTPWHDRANVESLRLYLEDDCEAAARTMAALRLRYVLIAPERDLSATLRTSAAIVGADPNALASAGGELRIGAARTLLVRLGRWDGATVSLPARRGSRPELMPACGRLRLVLEGYLRKGRRGRPGDIKLFEVVPGALLEGSTGPGAAVEVVLRVRSNDGGRDLRWRSLVRADGAGRYAMRLPFATDGSCPLRHPAQKPCPVLADPAGYLLRAGGAPPRRVQVPESTVQSGGSLPGG